MKLIKPILLATVVSTLDFSYRLLRHLQPDIWFWAISFLVFFMISFAIINNPEE